MTSVSAAAPPAPTARATPRLSALPKGAPPRAPVLQASESAVSYRPPPVAPPSPPTRRTSGTRATPAHTLLPALEHVSSISTNALTTSVS